MYLKYGKSGSDDVSESEAGSGEKDVRNLQKSLDVEEHRAAYLTAIITLVEDASEITLALYFVVGHGKQLNLIGQFCLLLTGVLHAVFNVRCTSCKARYFCPSVRDVDVLVLWSCRLG